MKTFKILLSAMFVSFLAITSLQVYATKWIVNVQNFSFSPSNLPNVIVGDTVRWVWISGSHTTTSTTIPFGAASWNEPITSSNQSYEYPVTNAGSYNYICVPHEGMGMVGSFTATNVVPVLVSIVPNHANQGESFSGTITGQNTGWSGTPSVSLSFSGNPGEIITGTNVNVLNPTHITANFVIPFNASPGFYNVHVDDLVMTNGFTVIEVLPAITFMTPNSAHQGDAFNGTIFGQNTSWSGTPSVYLAFSGNPSEIINGTNIIVINNTELTADFNVPQGASTGNYTIHVDALSQPNGFTVLAALTPALTSIIPDNGEQDALVSATITAENTSFSGSNPSVSLILNANPSEIITGSNIVVINNTTLTADFDIPYDATPGLWDLHVDDLMMQNSFTVIEVMPSILSIEPDAANQGELTTSLITGVNTHFTILEPEISLSLSSNASEVINASVVNVLNDTEVEATFNIPSNASTGKWDVHVDDLVMIEGYTVNLVIGVSETISDLISIYPNPASNWLFIENATGSDISVFNTTGKNIWSQKISSAKEAINVSQFTQGIYVIKIQMNGIIWSEKLFLN